MSIRAHVALHRETILPGDVRRSKPTRQFAITIRTPASTQHHYHPGPLTAAADYARGLIRAHQAANIRRSILNPSEPT
jgi:hypothetical protein